jgi:hypothetical protein
MKKVFNFEGILNGKDLRKAVKEGYTTILIDWVSIEKYNPYFCVDNCIEWLHENGYTEYYDNRVNKWVFSK